MTNNMFFIANWKMFGDLRALNSTKKVIKISKKHKFKKIQIIYCPPYTLINQFVKNTKNSKIKVGAQNCHYLDGDGPYTGKINSNLLKSIGAKYVILGHSENRAEGDTNYIINKKIKSALKKKLKIIFCFGETLSEKRNKKTSSVLRSQLTKCLKGINSNNNIIFAYEPVWSIGTGIIPRIDQLEQKIIYIKKLIKKNLKFKSSIILYGGSVNPKNINELKKITTINGFLVGGSSQNAKNFIDIIKKTIN